LRIAQHLCQLLLHILCRLSEKCAMLPIYGTIGAVDLLVCGDHHEYLVGRLDCGFRELGSVLLIRRVD